MSINIGLQAILAIFITHMEENHFLYLQKAIVKSETPSLAAWDINRDAVFAFD